MARVMARETAMKVAADGARLVSGSAGETGTPLSESLHLEEIIRTQAGSIDDMNYIADIIYDRNTRQ